MTQRGYTRGFALFVSLVMVVVVSLMTWTFMEFGFRNRLDSLRGEARIRAFHAAEAGARLYLATGHTYSFEMNDCYVRVESTDTTVTSSASTPKGYVTITLRLENGVVVERTEK